MLDQFLKLLERFVVAHELIAANSAKQVVVAETATIEPTVAKEEEYVSVYDFGAKADSEEEEKPKRKQRKAKVEEPSPEPEEEKKEVDYQSLRDQIQAIDDAINEGPSDAACDDSDELLEEFTGKKMKIAAIKDEDLAEYLERLTAIKNKYFEEE